MIFKSSLATVKVELVTFISAAYSKPTVIELKCDVPSATTKFVH